MCSRARPHFKFWTSTKNVYADHCSSVDGVIHLALKSNRLEMYGNVENGTKDMRSVNVGGTLNVVCCNNKNEACLSCGLNSMYNLRE